MSIQIFFKWMFYLLLLAVHPVNASLILNNPYPSNESDESIYYASFSEQPKTLDPAKSYSSNEYLFLGQIYEPLLQYDYFIRPYQLVLSTAADMPEVRYYHKSGAEVKAVQNQEIDHTVYTIRIKPGIFYQPHPAFAVDKNGHHRYFDLPPNFLDKYDISQLSDFAYTGTRQLIADDYIYQIKRLANPAVGSPIYGLMSEYIEGFREYREALANKETGYVDLRQYPLKGVRKIDDYTFEINIKGQYTQFQYWLSMPFFAPIPWEADKFYSQPDMEDKNLGFGWYPVGTGPFMLTENDPNSRMVLDKNPNYREAYFPSSAPIEDVIKGYLHHSGERLPLINQAIYTLEKEAIPRWTKFLQGYYDLSGVGADSFDQAIRITSGGEATLSPSLHAKGMQLQKVTDPSIYYLGFNMLDPIVGGASERARKLRRAISIAINYDEYIAIFFNGRGTTANGPIPPGIFGYKEGKEGINPYVYAWEGGRAKRRSIEDAKILMREAGYPGGRDCTTDKPLILHYDVPATGGPDDKAQLNWMRKQFSRIGIALNIRSTQYNRFQEKMRSGNAQIFSWGWNADYPDPENFLFLLYGPNSKVKHGGENAANYQNPTYDQLFELMKNRENDEKRQQLIDKMVQIVRHDAPWAWGVNSQTFILSQQWVAPIKPNTISQSTLKYMAIDVPLRNQLRKQWNRPVLWPIGVFILGISLLLLPFLFAYYKKKQQHAPRVKP